MHSPPLEGKVAGLFCFALLHAATSFLLCAWGVIACWGLLLLQSENAFLILGEHAFCYTCEYTYAHSLAQLIIFNQKRPQGASQPLGGLSWRNTGRHLQPTAHTS